MLYVLHQNAYTEEEAAKLTGLKLVDYKKAIFLRRTEDVDLNDDDFFKKCVREVDIADIPCRNVVRDLLTGDTHSFDRVSGGVMALWLMYYYNDRYLMPTCYFGENCYQTLLDASKEKDIYVFDDSDMLSRYEFSECEGVFTDYKTKQLVNCDYDELDEYTYREGY